MYKTLIKSLFFFQLLISLLAYADKPKEQTLPWWVEARFESDCSPAFKEYFSDYSACYTPLTRDLVAKKNLMYLKDLDTLNFVFNTDLDINADGNEEYIAVGVYTRQGKSGQFLVVAGDSKFEKIHKIFERGDIKNFSALSIQELDVSWYSCMNCNNKDKLIILNDNYFLD